MPLVHSKLKTYHSVQSDTPNNEPAVHGITAICGNTAPNDVETHRIMNLEHEEPRHNGYSFGYEPIIPVVCGRDLESPISSKTASGVASFKNETINAQKMEYVDMYNVQPYTLSTYELVTPYLGAHASVTLSQGAHASVTLSRGAHASVTPSQGAMKVAAVHSANESVLTMHRSENQILPSVKHFPQWT